MQLPTEKETESGCEFIANELVVDPRGADNLSQDARTIDLTPVFACLPYSHLTASAHCLGRVSIDRFISDSSLVVQPA